jgi:hypothetical protein
MFLFLKKKKEESLRPLSERDIQEKLYGHIRKKSPAEDSITVSTEQPATFNELFSPPAAEVPAAEKPAAERAPEPPRASQRPLHKITVVKAPRPRRQFKMPSLPRFTLPKLSVPKITFPNVSLPKFTMPKPTLPRFKKPRWIEKIEQIPLPMIAAGLLIAVILLVVSRAIAQGVFKGASGFRLIKVVRPETPRPPESREAALPAPTTAPAVDKALKAPVRPVPAIPQSPAAQKKFYTIQVIVYEDAAHAEAMLTRLKERRLEAFYRSIKTSRGKERYQVFVGHFKNYAEAQNHLGRYKKSGQLQDFTDSFVRPQVE